MATYSIKYESGNIVQNQNLLNKLIIIKLKLSSQAFIKSGIMEKKILTSLQLVSSLTNRILYTISNIETCYLLW